MKQITCEFQRPKLIFTVVSRESTHYVDVLPFQIETFRTKDRALKRFKEIITACEKFYDDYGALRFYEGGFEVTHFGSNLEDF